MNGSAIAYLQGFKKFFKVKACLYTNIHSSFIGNKHCNLTVYPSMNE